jgi:hypothetical protein
MTTQHEADGGDAARVDAGLIGHRLLVADGVDVATERWCLHCYDAEPSPYFAQRNRMSADEARSWNGKVIQTCCSKARARLIREKKT